jgi:hypothetical protein
VLQSVILFSILLVIVGGVCAWTGGQEMPANVPDDGGSDSARARFMSVVGLLVSLVFAIVVIAGVVPRLWLTPCD